MNRYFDDLIGWIKDKSPTKDQITKKKILLCKRYGMKRIPTDIEVLLHAGPVELSKLSILQTKPTRSLSGVAVVAVMTKPRKCPHGRCAMCPGGPESEFGTVPQSYTGKEPATRRALRNLFDPYLQVWNRLEQYVVTDHVPEKVELIIMGGTFPSAPKSYQISFTTDCFRAMNDFSSRFFKEGSVDIVRFRKFFELPGDISDQAREQRVRKRILKIKQSRKSYLAGEQKSNETAVVRCVGMTVETRPDEAGESQADLLLRLGCTRVELGVQTVYDDVLESISRGHSVADSRKATRVLKDRGFKINYHIMPGLPGVDRKRDLLGMKMLFSDTDFRPDMLKIYPCMVLKGTELYDRWKKKLFFPIDTKKAADLIAEFKKTVPEYVRIMRVQRDIPTFMTEAGVDRTNLRQYIAEVMKKKGTVCRCIRCREAGRLGKVFGKYRLKKMSYMASGGKEWFLSAEFNGIILGFIRVRHVSSESRKEIPADAAIVRELHVFGEASPLGKEGSVQHRGIGKKLLIAAEDLSVKHGKSRMVIISGVGVREYYRKQGYRKEGPYMVKDLK